MQIYNIISALGFLPTPLKSNHESDGNPQSKWRIYLTSEPFPFRESSPMRKLPLSGSRHVCAQFEALFKNSMWGMGRSSREN